MLNYITTNRAVRRVPESITQMVYKRSGHLNVVQIWRKIEAQGSIPIDNELLGLSALPLQRLYTNARESICDDGKLGMIQSSAIDTMVRNETELA